MDYFQPVHFWTGIYESPYGLRYYNAIFIAGACLLHVGRYNNLSQCLKYTFDIEDTRLLKYFSFEYGAV